MASKRWSDGRPKRITRRKSAFYGMDTIPPPGEGEPLEPGSVFEDSELDDWRDPAEVKAEAKQAKDQERMAKLKAKPSPFGGLSKD